MPRASRCGARGGRILVGHGAEDGLPIRDRLGRRGGDRQRAGTIRGGISGGRRQCQDILAAVEIARDLHRSGAERQARRPGGRGEGGVDRGGGLRDDVTGRAGAGPASPHRAIRRSFHRCRESGSSRISRRCNRASRFRRDWRGRRGGVGGDGCAVRRQRFHERLPAFARRHIASINRNHRIRGERLVPPGQLRTIGDQRLGVDHRRRAVWPNLQLSARSMRENLNRLHPLGPRQGGGDLPPADRSRAADRSPAYQPRCSPA